MIGAFAHLDHMARFNILGDQLLAAAIAVVAGVDIESQNAAVEGNVT